MSLASYFEPRSDSLLELLQAIAASRAVAGLAEALNQVLDQQIRGLRIKRVRIQQSLAGLQQRPTSPAAMESLAEFRSVFENNCEALRKGLAEQLQAVFAPYTGTVWGKLELTLERLTKLTWAKNHKSETSSIPREYLQSLLSEMSALIKKQCIRDALTARELWTVISSELDLCATKHKLQVTLPQPQALDASSYENLLARHLVFQRPYQGERVTHGLMEVIMHSRQFWFVFMIIFTSLGASWAILNNPHYAYITVPFRFLLLGSGVIATIHYFRTEKEEADRRELERAREWIKNEFRRILPEVHRAWLLTLAEHLAEESKNGLLNLEGGIRLHLTKQTSELIAEKTYLQSQLQSLENSEKRLLPVARTREALTSSLAQLIGEYKQLLLAQWTSSRRRG